MKKKTRRRRVRNAGTDNFDEFDDWMTGQPK